MKAEEGSSLLHAERPHGRDHIEEDAGIQSLLSDGRILLLQET